MTPKLLTGILLCLALLQSDVFAQNKDDHSKEKMNVKFGKLTPADFDLSAYQYDSGASAVIIADLGDSHIEGNMKGSFSLIYKHYRRVKIINKGGYDVAQEEIPLWVDGNTTETLDDLKAATYNLENGKVVETRLDDKSVFAEKANKHRINKKFGFPAVKEGSIIEYSYTVKSDFLFNLQPWAFQGEYPCLWSEYDLTIPEYFRYVFLSQGYQPFYIKSTKDGFFSGKVTIPGGAEKDETISLNGKATDYRWVMKNVPSLRPESFTTTPANHIAKIEFQLSQIVYPETPPKSIMGNWTTVSEKLMESESFGAAISKNNGWMDDEVKSLTSGATEELEKAKKIYTYIRDNFACTDHNGFETDNSLKSVFKARSGSAADINLLLVAMLEHAHLNSDPVILGTRPHGYTNEIYPLLERFNYVVCKLNVGESVYYLDASQPWVGFGYLPDYCYNGHARVVNKINPGPVYFEADSLKEQRTTLVFISNEEKGVIGGNFQSTYGHIASSEIREKIHKDGEKQYFKEIQSTYPAEFAISGLAIDSLKMPEEPLKVSYDFKFKPSGEEDLIYFNPLMGEGYKSNPFKSAERKYPVEMPYVKDETFILNMAVPDGYAIDEIPKSAKVLFNDTEGYFEYLVASDGQNIQLRSHIKLTRANFTPDDYETLREFYGFIVKKQGEQIVFKKKK